MTPITSKAHMWQQVKRLQDFQKIKAENIFILKKEFSQSSRVVVNHHFIIIWFENAELFPLVEKTVR